MDKSKVKKALKSISAAVNQLLEAMEDIEQPKTKTVEPKTVEPVEAESKSWLEKIQNDSWPAAVSGDLLVSTDDDKTERAEGILGVLSRPLQGKKFLDFGCGEGHVIRAAVADGAVLSVGYDLVAESPFVWEVKENDVLLTTDFEKVKLEGPYDYILLYDVLDHVEDPKATLQQVREVCLPTSEVIVRCHPWCSRHGGHLYKTLNKAFAHLFLTEDEIAQFADGKTPIGSKVMWPQREYQSWFTDAHFSYKLLSVEKEEVEAVFVQSGLVSKHLNKLWGSPDYKTKLEQSFVDYSLRIV